MAEQVKQSTIKLRSADGEVFEVEVDVARMSVTLRTMMDDLGLKQEDDEEIPIQNVNSSILRKVIQWATYHKADPPAVEEVEESEPKSCDNISTWDVDFLKVDQTTLFEIILAANYLDIKGLLDVACKTVGGMIRGKSPDELVKHFNIVNDFTPSELEQIKREQEWCEDK